MTYGCSAQAGSELTLSVVDGRPHLSDNLLLLSGFIHRYQFIPVGDRAKNKKLCYRWLHSVLRVKHETCILPIKVGAFKAQTLREWGQSLPKFDTVR